MSNPFAAKTPSPAPDDKPEEVIQQVVKEEEKAVTHSDAIANTAAQERKVLPISNPGSLPQLGMDEVSCRTCRFLEFEGSSRRDAGGGECRRNAPVPGVGQLASWPAVDWKGWCGEWQSGISDEDMVKMARALADSQADGPTGGFQESEEEGETQPS